MQFVSPFESSVLILSYILYLGLQGDIHHPGFDRKPRVTNFALEQAVLKFHQLTSEADTRVRSGVLGPTQRGSGKRFKSRAK